MGIMQIVPETASAEELNALVMASEHRPLATMEDFSVMALRVDRLRETLRAVENGNYRWSGSLCGITVACDNIEQLDALLKTLAQHNIRWEMTDIAEGMYQG